MRTHVGIQRVEALAVLAGSVDGAHAQQRRQVAQMAADGGEFGVGAGQGGELGLALFGREDSAICTNRRENEGPDGKAGRCSAGGEFTRFVGGQAQADAHTGPAASHRLRRS
ncbi:hypothetical protein CKO37_09655 [Rubrivivax gelatinosus]|nr:hypothetical protein [Rubrivivax gelatinosus]